MEQTTTPARKRRTPEERREEITRAAITLFARQGFTRTTTKEIAAEAGISEGTIYKYFPSKQDLLFAFIGSKALSGIPILFQTQVGEDDTVIIRRFIEDRFQVWRRSRDLIRVVIGEALFTPNLAEGLDRMITSAVKVIEDYIARRIAEGAFREVNPAIAARTLFGHVFAYFIKWDLLMPEGYQVAPQDELIEELTTLFINGIRRQPDSETVV